ncbi:MAG: hypothetical protein KJ749_04295, partial [Planctomycetes bacterium]|nr:hypothetical protein [Planctomycetota bacterium]
MRQRRVLWVLAAVPVLCASCATTGVCPATDPGGASVAVRFVTPPAPSTYADSATFESQPTLGLGIDPPGGETVYEEQRMATKGYGSNPHHVVLWGGPFEGTAVDYATASLEPGQYMFGVFDQDQGTAYQGWIQVNNPGNDVINVLTEWRNTIHDQEQWLGYENKVSGNFGSRDPEYFEDFTRQLRETRRLERRINRTLQFEKCDFWCCRKQQAEVLSDAEILLIPGAADFFRPSTQPAFSEAELDTIRSGDPMTKVVLVADYGRAREKMLRVNGLWDDLRRYRSVLIEDYNRLERHKRYLTITDHLYHHDQEFVETEQRLQDTHRLIAKIDQQCDDYRKHAHALAFVTGLFAPDEAHDAFYAEEQRLRRERIVLEEQKTQFDLRYDNTGEGEWKRVSLERDRQNLMASIEGIDEQLEEISGARIALGKLRDSTTVIHRHGTARVLATTMFHNEIEGHLANAIENESLMTVRLQATDSLYAPPNCNVAQQQNKARIRTVSCN